MSEVAQQLPSADHRRLISNLLDLMGYEWSHNDTLVSSCREVGPCEAHRDRGEVCKGAKGISYFVTAGPLSGVWKGWGRDAERNIFDRMVGQLDAAWLAHFRTSKSVARTLRSVGR